MKSHISATLDSNLLKQLDRFGQQEHRSRSQLIELAVEDFLRKHFAADNGIVTSNGHFAGRFDREDTHDR